MPNYYVFVWGHKPDPNEVEVVLVGELEPIKEGP